MGWSKSRFEIELKKYDRLLRVRMSWTGKWWLIERKCAHGSLMLIKPRDLDLFPDRFDEYKRDKDGFTFVFKVRRDLLGPLAMHQLMDSDMWRNGGANAVADRLEEQEARAEEELEASQSAHLQARGEEIYDQQMIKQGDIVSGFHSQVGGMEFANSTEIGGREQL